MVSPVICLISFLLTGTRTLSVTFEIITLAMYTLLRNCCKINNKVLQYVLYFTMVLVASTCRSVR